MESKFKILRNEKKLTQMAVAIKAGCSLALIHWVDNGYVPAMPSKKKLAKALGVEVKDVWPEE